MKKYNHQDLELYHRHALIRASEDIRHYAKFYRNIYKTNNGKYIVRFNNETRSVYLSKIYGDQYGWFLNPKA